MITVDSQIQQPQSTATLDSTVRLSVILIMLTTFSLSLSLSANLLLA